MKYIALVGMVSSLALSGCKLGISVFEGGSVQSTSGVYSCSAGSACVVEIPDTNFYDTFVAVPDSGYKFVRWSKGDGFHCGGSTNSQCTISTTNLRGDEVWEEIIAGDDYMYLSPQFEYVGAGTSPKPGPALQACLTAPDSRYYSSDSTVVMRNGTTLNNYNGKVYESYDEFLIFKTTEGKWFAIEDFGESWSELHQLDVIKGPNTCFTPEKGFGEVKSKYRSSGYTYIVLSTGAEVRVNSGSCLGVEAGHKITAYDYDVLVSLNTGASCTVSEP